MKGNFFLREGRKGKAGEEGTHYYIRGKKRRKGKDRRKSTWKNGYVRKEADERKKPECSKMTTHTGITKGQVNLFRFKKYRVNQLRYNKRSWQRNPVQYTLQGFIHHQIRGTEVSTPRNWSFNKKKL